MPSEVTLSKSPVSVIRVIVMIFPRQAWGHAEGAVLTVFTQVATLIFVASIIASSQSFPALSLELVCPTSSFIG